MQFILQFVYQTIAVDTWNERDITLSYGILTVHNTTGRLSSSEQALLLTQGVIDDYMRSGRSASRLEALLKEDNVSMIEKKPVFDYDLRVISSNKIYYTDENGLTYGVRKYRPWEWSPRGSRN
ncbi:hypothetical protein KIN20_003673 [Parelaphostrongylus tenuis]|uniref:Uncharacterized protein n=1 Tax=Parelaphostrongylus tenuis TaxID=148309 RepID=A0AAD5MFZ6_PARTN|nr:hypothetical protein KIN20_003673 [Parelaphostrongylus tenuis]